jgi:hypothetical protein
VDELFQKKGFVLVVYSSSSVQAPPSSFKDSPRFVQSLTALRNSLPLQLGAAHLCVDSFASWAFLGAICMPKDILLRSRMHQGTYASKAKTRLF